MSNPFYAEWPSPFGLPSFSDIEPIHFEEAFQAGFDQNNEEIDTIANSLEDPTFANTVVELERAGELLSRVADVFFNLSIADTNDQIEALELKIPRENPAEKQGHDEGERTILQTPIENEVKL